MCSGTPQRKRGANGRTVGLGGFGLGSPTSKGRSVSFGRSGGSATCQEAGASKELADLVVVAGVDKCAWRTARVLHALAKNPNCSGKLRVTSTSRVPTLRGRPASDMLNSTLEK